MASMYYMGEGVEKDPESAKRILSYIKAEESKEIK